MSHEVVFLQDIQKYLSISRDPIIEYYTTYYSRITPYTEENYNRKILTQSEREREALTECGYNALTLLQAAVNKCAQVPLSDKPQLLAILKKMESLEMLKIHLWDSKAQCPKDFITPSLSTQAQESLRALEQFNQLNKEFKQIIKKFDTGEPVFIQAWVDYSTLQYGSREYGDKKHLLYWQDILLKPKSLSTVQKFAYKYVVEHNDNILNSCMQEGEFNAQTDNSYIIYCKRYGREGFYNKNNVVGAFSDAQTFHDAKKAVKSCSANRISDYQIWQISSKFIKKAIEKNCTEGPLLTSIIVKQEKDFIQEVMKVNEVVDMREKIAHYERVLKDNNLSHEIKVPSVEAQKKLHKL